MSPQKKFSKNSVFKKEAVLLVVALMFSLVVLSAPNVKASNQISITAVADSYVDNSSPDANYGRSIFLYTHKYSEGVAQASAGDGTQNFVGPIGNTWLKFDLSQIPSTATIDSVTLKMHTAVWGTRSINNVGVFTCDDNSWSESGITWNNAPSTSSTPLQTADCGDPNLDYSFNINPVLTGKSAVSIVLETTQFAKEPAVFNSRDLSNPPTLIVSYTVPFDAGLILPIGIGVAAIVIVVLGVFTFKRRTKNNPKKPIDARANP